MTCQYCHNARKPRNDSTDVAGCSKQPAPEEHNAPEWYEGWYYAHRSLDDAGGDETPDRGLLHNGNLFPINTKCKYFTPR